MRHIFRVLPPRAIGAAAVLAVAAVAFVVYRGSESQDASGPAPTRIAFNVDGGPGSTADLYVARADGSRRIRVTRARGDEYSPSWSPDGRRIVYRAERERQTPPEIMVVNADGTGSMNLTNTPSGTEWSPAWSPDGRTLAYASDAGEGDLLDIWLMDPTGGNKRNLTREPHRADEYPAFAPDGGRIAYISFDSSGDFEIYVVNLDGSGKQNLTQRPGKDEWPSWSPDGTKIAFMSEREGMADIFVMNADGSQVTNLTKTPDVEESFPAWRSDGKISFIRGSVGDERTHLWLMNGDGSDQVRLLENVTGPVAWTTG